jgi:hypothetical protein
VLISPRPETTVQSLQNPTEKTCHQRQTRSFVTQGDEMTDLVVQYELCLSFAVHNERKSIVARNKNQNNDENT